MKTPKFLFLPIAATLALATPAKAATLYENPFVVPGGTGSGANLVLDGTVAGWAGFTGPSGTLHNAASRVWITDRIFKDAPPDTYGYLAFDAAGGTAANPKIAATTTPLNINSTAPDLTFTWLMGNSSTVPTIQIAVEVGGQWYASVTSFTTAAQTLGDFSNINSTTAETKTLVYSPIASNWNILNFTPDTTLSMGGMAPSDLSGNITGLGFYTPNSTEGIIRIADFNVTAVPEPSPYALGLIALAAFVAIRFCRARPSNSLDGIGIAGPSQIPKRKRV